MIYLPTYKRRVLFEKTNGKEDLFLFVTEGLKIKSNPHDGDRTFWMRDEKIIFDYSRVNRLFWCSFDEYWAKLHKEFKWSSDAVYFTIKMLDKHFKLRIDYPYWTYEYSEKWTRL